MKRSQMNSTNDGGGYGGDVAQYEHTHNPN
jgi:hypothetical protein